MIELKNVSKFYYGKGVISTGFSKLNVSFNLGEFVVITGESGSGKSTLLNVISGLDTYEDGEMFIDGKETSHFTRNDILDYRRKYIGNIFQNFNLVNSYTVYQNIELVLLLNGQKKKDIKKDVIELIKKVDLYKFRNTKVSKLSGGQKQRVAIARALAKNTPIIIADEPTGNLDSRSAKSIIKLLSLVSKDKLVIVVTHNLDEIKDYATRIIKMNDGKIIEDTILKDANQIVDYKETKYRNVTFLNKIRLGIRNTFNIKIKFILLLFVFLFISTALLTEYSSFKKAEYLESINGYNDFFQNFSDKRIIINKKNKNVINEDDFNKISKLDNVDYVVKNDVVIDTGITLTNKEYTWLYGRLNSINNYYDTVDVGRLPLSDDEIIISGSKDSYFLNDVDNILNKNFYISNDYTGEIDESTKLVVVGIKYYDNYESEKFYVSDSTMKKLSFDLNQKYSSVKILLNDKLYDSNIYDQQFKIEANSNVPDGEAFFSGDYNYYCKYDNCINSILNINVNNIYYDDNTELKITKNYYKWNIKKLLNITDYDNNNGKVFISINDYNNLYNKGYYQSSVFVKDINKIDETVNELNDLGFKTLKLKDAVYVEEVNKVLRIFKVIVTVILVVILFFISYFVIRIILKSRNVYYSTIRILGANKKICRDLLIIELLNINNISFFIVLLFGYLNYKRVIGVKFLTNIIEYLKFNDLILLYIILMCLTYLISIKYSKKLFNKSAIQTINEEI